MASALRRGRHTLAAYQLGRGLFIGWRPDAGLAGAGPARRAVTSALRRWGPAAIPPIAPPSPGARFGPLSPASGGRVWVKRISTGHQVAAKAAPTERRRQKKKTPQATSTMR